MTVAVAVIKNGRTVLAADSLVTFGGQRFGPDNTRFQKIRQVGSSLLTWAGWSIYGELLTAHLGATSTPVSNLSTEAEVFDFFIRFWRVLRDEYTYRPYFGDRDSRDHPFASLDSTFLLANRHGIFRVAADLDVAQFQQYTAVGSGSPYALGALRVLYDTLDDAEDIAHRAVQVGIDFEIHCGGDIDLQTVDH